MYIKNLKICSIDGLIRDIEFKKGLNLIVDNTDILDEKNTGNNVGKTTVLKLVDFCLGAEAKIVYTDTENKKEEYHMVKEFLIEKEVKVCLLLVDDLENEYSKKISIERNFLPRAKKIRTINGKQYKEDEFESKLNELLIPENEAEKPSFRQIISHNIRYKDIGINNTLKTVNRYTTDVEYETLYLFLLGCNYDEGAKKKKILDKLTREREFMNRLEKINTRNACETVLFVLNSEIDELQNKKKNMNINERFKEDLDLLNNIKYSINKVSSKISTLEIRRDLIIDAKNELEANKSDVDLVQLKLIYEQANVLIDNLQKKFEELVMFHNNMIHEKAKYISAELPEINQRISNLKLELNELLVKEKKLAGIIAKSDSFEEFEIVVKELNDKFQQKGEYENLINQISDVEKNISKFEDELAVMDVDLFSEDFEKSLKEKIFIFNKYFMKVSQAIYGEKYLLKYEKTYNNKKKQSFYKFSSFNANVSSGKKQGEILCFDLAYNQFAEANDISQLNFILNDKKELMHGNQLSKLAKYINNYKVQVVMSILRDKLPAELDNEKYVIVQLAQDDKLFRIEQ